VAIATPTKKNAECVQDLRLMVCALDWSDGILFFFRPAFFVLFAQ
jgi:hypothetical protein